MDKEMVIGTQHLNPETSTVHAQLATIATVFAFVTAAAAAAAAAEMAANQTWIRKCKTKVGDRFTRNYRTQSPLSIHFVVQNMFFPCQVWFDKSNNIKNILIIGLRASYRFSINRTSSHLEKIQFLILLINSQIRFLSHM